MNKNIFFPILLSALAVVSCGQKPASKGSLVTAEPVEEKVYTVDVMSASLQDVPQDAVYTSTVQANVVNNIAPQATGRIVKVNCEIGDFVKAGQILAEMDASSLDQAKLKLKNSEDEWQRVRQLYSEGGISQSDYEQLELSYKVAKSSYNNLLENTILRSPVTGVVTARNYDKGDMYSMSQPLFTVQQITPVKLLIGISETDYTRVKKGDEVSVTVDAIPGETFSGQVVRIYPTVDAATHTFNVEVQVANTEKVLRPGMYARCTVTFGVNRSVVLPDAAVMRQQGSGQKLVYVVDADNVATSRVVTLGRHMGQSYEILDGIAEGEKVVVKGQATLKNGSKVAISE